jgi:tRNA(fMet)-specific endonuclease VapC
LKYLADTDRLIDTQIGIPEAIDLIDLLSPSGIGISIITAGEMYEGAIRSSDATVRLARCRAFLSAFPVLPLSDPIMERFARIRAELRGQGNLIPDLDLLIAATALEHDLTLLTRNVQHFMRVTGLKLYQAT